MAKFNRFSQLYSLIILLSSLGLGNSFAITSTTNQFSSPQDTSNKPLSWQQQQINYEQETKDNDLVLSLDQELYHAVLPIIDRYAKQTGLKIAVNKGTCGISAGLLANKAIDMGGYCCPPGQKDRLPGLQFHTLGIAAIGIYVHPNNDAKTISHTELQDVFQGYIYNWGQLKSVPASNQTPIELVTRLHCKQRPGHWRLILPSDELFSPNAFDVSSIPDMISSITDNPQAIGYETLFMAKSALAQKQIKMLMINGYHPNNQLALQRGLYPYYRVFSITSWQEKHLQNQHMPELIAYLKQHTDEFDPSHSIINSDTLRQNGWIFSNHELTAMPPSTKK